MNKNNPAPHARGAQVVRLSRYASQATVAPLLCLSLIIVVATSRDAHAQTSRSTSTPEASSASYAAATPPLLRRTTRREMRRVGFGGTLTLYGAPDGAIKIEAWSRPEIEIVADTELRADTEEELARLAEVNTFALDHDASRLRVNTLGTHDRKHMKRAGGKDFPKKLLAAAWRMDYTVRVPTFTDLEIHVGRGAVSVEGVEGALRLNVTEGDTTLALTGGDCVATVARGRVILRPASRSWRGRGIDIRLGTGELVAELPAGFNADFDARVLRTGTIDNTFGEPEPFTLSAPPAASLAAKTLRGRYGAGGASLSLTVGDGNISVRQAHVVNSG